MRRTHVRTRPSSERGRRRTAGQPAWRPSESAVNIAWVIEPIIGKSGDTGNRPGGLCSCSNLAFPEAGETGLEPATPGFGDRCKAIFSSVFGVSQSPKTPITTGDSRKMLLLLLLLQICYSLPKPCYSLSEGPSKVLLDGAHQDRHIARRRARQEGRVAPVLGSDLAHQWRAGQAPARPGLAGHGGIS